MTNDQCWGITLRDLKDEALNHIIVVLFYVGPPIIVEHTQKGSGLIKTSEQFTVCIYYLTLFILLLQLLKIKFR